MATILASLVEKKKEYSYYYTTLASVKTKLHENVGYEKILVPDYSSYSGTCNYSNIANRRLEKCKKGIGKNIIPG